MVKQFIRVLLFLCMLGEITYAQTKINPNQIQPSSSNGYILTTVGGITSWNPAPSGGPTIQTNSVNNSSQTSLNFTNSSTLQFSNPSIGIESGIVINSPAVGGITVTGTPSIGQVLTATSASAANWQSIPTVITGQTIGYLLLASSATTSTSSSLLQDTGTSLIYHGTGTAHGITLAASTTSISPASGFGIIETDSSGNIIISENNNTAARVCTATNKECGYFSIGPTFSISGCSTSSLTGGSTTGQFTSGTTGTCTATVTIGGSMTAPTGWSCWVNDLTTPTDVIHQTAYTNTTVTLSGTTINGDILNFGCIGY
jgi:hypothetical protein